MSYVIYDIEDKTYHHGGGLWGLDEDRAVRYESFKAADGGLDDVDCAKILRHRLTIVEMHWLEPLFTPLIETRHEKQDGKPVIRIRGRGMADICARPGDTFEFKYKVTDKGLVNV